MQRLLLEKLDAELLDKAGKTQKKLLALKRAANKIKFSFVDVSCERGQRLLQVAVRKRIPDLISEVDKFTSIVISFINDLNELMKNEAEDSSHLDLPVGQFFAFLKAGREAIEKYDKKLGQKEIKKAIASILDRNELKIFSKISKQSIAESVSLLVEQIEDLTIDQLMTLPASVESDGVAGGESQPLGSKQATPGKSQEEDEIEEEDDGDEDLIEGNCTEEEIAESIFTVLKVRKFRKGGKKLEKISKSLAVKLVNSNPGTTNDIVAFFNQLNLKRQTKLDLADAVKKCFEDGEAPSEEEVAAAASGQVSSTQSNTSGGGGKSAASPSPSGQSGETTSAEAPTSGVEESDDEWVKRVANLVVNGGSYEDDVKKKLKQLGYTKRNLDDIWNASQGDVLHKFSAELNKIYGDRFDKEQFVGFLNNLIENLRKRHGAVLVERWQRLAGIIS